MVKNVIKKILPESAVDALRYAHDSIVRIPDDIRAITHPIRRDSIRRLQRFKNQYDGQRCFIIGNGPSLKNTDLSKLENEYTFGMNRIFLMFPELGFKTTFFVSVNDLVIKQSANEIQELDMPRFVSWRAKEWLTPEENLFFLYTTYTGPKFAKNAAGRLWEGATVTYTSLQLAYFMGFTKVILIGVDHNFKTKGKPNATITSTGDDPNHFHPQYFGKGFRWQLPDLETSELAYIKAKQVYGRDGREVVDATVGGKLKVFPKADYESLF